MCFKNPTRVQICSQVKYARNIPEDSTGAPRLKSTNACVLWTLCAQLLRFGFCLVRKGETRPTTHALKSWLQFILSFSTVDSLFCNSGRC